MLEASHATDPVATGCPTRLLGDDPAEKDEFGSHDRLANAIASVVESESGGKAIGLSGKWGSGKSTVIHLLKTHLEEVATRRVWVFDAWAHEGDHLRRTFLESLIGFLSENGWVDKKRWAEKTAELARRVKKERHRTTPRLSTLGSLLLGAVALVPVGNVTLKYGLELGVALHGQDLNVPFAIGLLLSLGPLIVLGSAWAWALLRGSEGKSGLEDVLALMVQKAVTETTTETLETPEPTSLEFESVFGSLIQEALRDPARRLVLVIDNLDRIEPADALRVWATLQTFLNHRPGAPEWLRSLWVLMAFDPQAIKRLWRDSQGGAGDMASSFLDKSFQVQFYVPPPLVSDWRGYMLSGLRAALPLHKDSEFHSIYRVAAVRFRNGLMPRDVKLYINQIGALHRLRGHEFPLQSLAYFAALKREAKLDVASELLKGGIPNPEEAALLPADIADTLAALEFGQSAARANQILLLGPTQEALAVGDGARLSLLQARTEGAPEVLEIALSAASAEWNKGSGAAVLNAFVALDEAGLLGKAEEHRSAMYVQQVVRAAWSVERIVLMGGKVESGLISLARRTNDEGLVEHMFGAYASSIAEIPSDQRAAVQDLASRAATLMSELHDVGMKGATKAGVEIPGGLAEFSACLKDLRRAHRDTIGVWPSLRPGISRESLSSEMMAVVQQGTFRREHADVLYATRKLVPSQGWVPVIDAMRARLFAGNQLVPEEAGALALGMCELMSVPHGLAALRGVVLEGHLAHQMRFMSGDAVSLARSMYAFLQVAPGLDPQQQVGQSQSGYALLSQQLQAPMEGVAEELGDLLQENGLGDVPLELFARNQAARPLVRSVVKWLQANEPDRYLTPKRVVGKWKVVREVVELAWDASNAKGMAEEVMRGPFDIESGDLYAALLEGAPGEVELRRWCAQGLRQLEGPAWDTVLEVDGPLLKLLLLCGEEELGLGHVFRDALGRRIQETMDGDLTANAHLDEVRWKRLVQSLDPSQRETLEDDLLEDLRKAEGQANPAFLEICSASIRAQRVEEHPDFVIRILEPLVVHGNLRGLQWVARLVGENPRVLTVGKLAHRAAVAERLRSLEDDEIRQVALPVLAALQVPDK